ncbi:MAG: ASCH domain-containing protein [Patescibacteria group bacterium]
MKLTKVPFEKIKNEQKFIESRLYDEKRQQINIGDRIKFICNDNQAESIITRTKALYRYQSFNDLFSDFPPEYFGGSSKKSLIEEVRKFYPIEEEQQYGVIGIKLELEK